VGGIESIPIHLLPWKHPRSLIHELVRNSSNALQAVFDFGLRRRASSFVLSTTREMRQRFGELGIESKLMPTIGLHTKALPFRPREERIRPLKLLYVGNIVTLKGLDLAIDALKLSNTDATFTIVGSGDYMEPLEAQARALGLEDRVSFMGRLPREQVLHTYGDYDVFVFPSLHDTGGFAVIEAMFNELPVICLDCGGPAVAVREGCGVKVPIGSRKEIVAALAAAIRMYSEDSAALRRHANQARQVILQEYDWERKGKEMNGIYEEVFARHKTPNPK
jgi:glycosyltransferase involved in cell wall biosynthesis